MSPLLSFACTQHSSHSSISLLTLILRVSAFSIVIYLSFGFYGRENPFLVEVCSKEDSSADNPHHFYVTSLSEQMDVLSYELETEEQFWEGERLIPI